MRFVANQDASWVRKSEGGFEVAPDAIRGKRLTIPSGQTLSFICIGKWKNGGCEGIYIGWGVDG